MSLALRVDFLETGDMKIITATIVIIALTTPKIIDYFKEKKRKARRRTETLKMIQATAERKGENHAALKSDS